MLPPNTPSIIKNLTDQQVAARDKAMAESLERERPRTNFRFFAVTLCKPGIKIYYNIWYTMDEARNEVLSGSDVYTLLGEDAQALAWYASGGSVCGNEKFRVQNGENAFHYHLKNKLLGSHIFYGFQGVVGSVGYAGTIYPY